MLRWKTGSFYFISSSFYSAEFSAEYKWIFWSSQFLWPSWVFGNSWDNVISISPSLPLSPTLSSQVFVRASVTAVSRHKLPPDQWSVAFRYHSNLTTHISIYLCRCRDAVYLKYGSHATNAYCFLHKVKTICARPADPCAQECLGVKPSLHKAQINKLLKQVVFLQRGRKPTLISSRVLMGARVTLILPLWKWEGVASTHSKYEVPGSAASPFNWAVHPPPAKQGCTRATGVAQDSLMLSKRNLTHSIM